MSASWEQPLRNEFSAGEGSFTLQLRINRRWDRAAFSRLTDAMKECAEAHEKAEILPRWIAEGFWYLATFVREWCSHENFPRPLEASYYAAAYKRLDDLAYWFFRGQSPYVPEHKWAPL